MTAMCTRAMISGVGARRAVRAEPRELFLMHCSYAMPRCCSCVVLWLSTACNEHLISRLFAAGRTSLSRLLHPSFVPPTLRRTLRARVRLASVERH